ncbi:HK97 family phage prohead protease [Chelativorans sp. SCAU2101]|uniref:HK97 family phage prohead protease n=1 Tax=Chelativorans petroleitrophicus TaxID=2975484 RepID=A0A9X3AZ09_9HYPH|nr:HK97 family phage prohead protease [Chelativorans petroleitrophicus]MCT8989014.1 HK97 family phage prohead protease [Chelativorans petroleitrophicus]
MLLHGGVIGELEIRRSKRGGRRLKGRFPYGKRAVLSDGGRTGRPKKERFAPRAFSYRVEAPDKEIHLLMGHDFNRPLASKLTGTLQLRDTPEALTFTADITPEIAATSYGRDVLAQIDSGLAYGISPGFRIPPRRAVPNAEKIEQEPDDGTIDEDGEPRRGAIIRTILSALLYELSIVTRPAYKESTIETEDEPGEEEEDGEEEDNEQIAARNWEMTKSGLIVPEPPDAGLRRALARWRA